MSRAFFGFYTYLEFFLTALLLLPVFALVALFTRSDPTRRARGRMLRRFGRITSRMTPMWRFKVEGAPPADILERAYVVVSNHESTADPFLLSFLPWDMRWVAKESLFKAPVVGWLMRLGGDIALKRGKRESVEAMLEECRQMLRAGMPVMLFPEGTRTMDGRLLPFKDGAFQLAIETQVPVLPLVLAGSRECRPKGSLWFGWARARVRVLEPVPTAGLTAADLPVLREKVRDRIAQAAAELRRDMGLPDVFPDAPDEAAAPVAEPSSRPQ